MSGRAPTLQFLGGAGTVTGSKFRVSTDRARSSSTAGCSKGSASSASGTGSDAVPIRRRSTRRADPRPRRPLRVLAAARRRRLRGPVFATPGTIELARIVLPDCGHLQEEEAEYANRKGLSRHDPALPLYTEDDAWRAVELLRPLPFHERPRRRRRHLGATLPGRPHPRLGDMSSCSSARTDRRSGSAAISAARATRSWSPPDPPEAVDCLLVESTYGDRRHDDADAVTRLAAAITTTIERGGSVLIPAFAVDRTEVLLHHLARLAASGRLPDGVPIFVDSPMALDALSRLPVARSHAAIPTFDPSLATAPPVRLPGLREVRDVEGSKALNHPARRRIIISASGMASGGRVVHHLAHLLPDARNTVLLVGYQAEGTRGRRLLDGATELKLLGRYVRVRASIIDLPAFSVHADAPELLAWVAAAPRPPDNIYVVHGEGVGCHRAGDLDRDHAGPESPSFRTWASGSASTIRPDRAPARRSTRSTVRQTAHWRVSPMIHRLRERAVVSPPTVTARQRRGDRRNHGARRGEHLTARHLVHADGDVDPAGITNAKRIRVPRHTVDDDAPRRIEPRRVVLLPRTPPRPRRSWWPTWCRQWFG